MALVLKDRVKETSTTAGTGTITLAGAVAGFQSFSAVGNGNTTYYAIVDPTTGDWEVGIGTYTSSGTTLSRDTVLSSSNSGSLVNFVANQKDVFVTYPSEKSVYEDASNVVNATSFGAITATSAALTTGTVSTAPASGTDIANKTYVDTLVSSGITYHTPVKYEVPDSTGNLNATYNQPGGPGVGVGATLTNAGTLVAFTPDGTVATAGDRIIIYNQTNQFENGIYTVTTVGSGAVAWVLTRATDADTYALKSPNGLGNGDAFFITSGATGAGETYVCNTAGVITFGTTAITFAQISDSTLYTAGTGLTLTGTEFSITPTGTAGTYGSASSVPVLTTNASGQVTSVTNTTIAINGSQVSGNISGSAGSVANSLTLGTYLTGGTYNGSAAVTATVDATSANTASKVVARDSSGNFSAGTITATLSGSATSATTATNLAGGAANQIAYQSASGTTSFATAPSASNQVLNWNGSAFTWSAGTISGVPLGSNLNSLTAGTYLTGTAYNGSTAQTWAVDATSANTASKVVARDASGDFSAGTITASLSGNATSATNSTTTSQRAFSGDISTTGQGRFTGWYSGNAATGLGVEAGISSGEGYVIAYDRTTSTYGALNIQTSSASLRLSGSTVNVSTGALQQGGSQVLTAANYNSYAPTLTGTGASGTWNISITGSAGSAPGYLPLSGGTMTGTITGGSGVTSLVTGNYAGALRGYLYNDTDGFGFLTYAGNWAVRVDYGTNSVYIPGIGYSAASLRAPIFYDSDNTSYYANMASTSSFNVINSYALAYQGGVSADNTWGIFFDSGLSTSYAIYRAPGAWTSPYPDLRIAFHTGIQIGANSSYGGVRFYTDYDMATEVMSVNNSAVGLGASNVYVNNSLVAGSDLRAPIFYDSNDTSYYGDFAGTSVLSNLIVNYATPSGSTATPAVNIRKGWSGMTTVIYDTVAIQSNDVTTIRVGEQDGTTGGYCQGDGYNTFTSTSPMRFYTGGSATGYIYSGMGGTLGLYVESGSTRAPIFYDYNDTSYYVDPASLSNLTTVNVQNAVSNNTGGLRNVMPGGGAYTTSASSVSGAIVVRLPTNLHPMIRFTVKVYTYDGLSFDINCGGHNSGGIWYNTFAWMATQHRPAMNVRFTYDGTYVYVYIGDLGSSWSYPQVFITDVQVGYSITDYSYWDDGWSISFNTSTYNNVSATHTVYPPTSTSNNTNPAYASIYYDANNTGYYVDPASVSSLSYVLADNWFRTVGQTGLYSNSYGQHFYPNSTGAYWKQSSTTTYGGTVYTYGYEGAIKGYTYWDTSGFGLLHGGGGWSVRGNLGAVGGQFYGSWFSDTDLRAPIFYDYNNTGYYLDPASTSILNVLNCYGNVTAYYSSDIKFKTNVRDIPNAIETVESIGGKLFDWTDEYLEEHGGEDPYFMRKEDFGVVAQDVLKVFPVAVRTRPDGSLAVDYEKLSALAFAAVAELSTRVKSLEARI